MNDQPTNPIMARQPETAKRGKVTVEMLRDAAERYNRSQWVIASGLPYFVNSRIEDGKGVVHFLDRKIAVGNSAQKTT